LIYLKRMVNLDSALQANASAIDFSSIVFYFETRASFYLKW